MFLLSEHIPTPADNSSHSADIELSKVYSFDKRTELLNILHSEHPDHYSRLYLVGFLKHVGYTLEQVCDIIHADNAWQDYDVRTTWLHVDSVFRNNSHISKQVVSLPSFLYSSNKESVVTNPLYVADDCPCRIQWTACEECKTKGCMNSGSFRERSK